MSTIHTPARLRRSLVGRTIAAVFETHYERVDDEPGYASEFELHFEDGTIARLTGTSTEQVALSFKPAPVMKSVSSRPQRGEYFIVANPQKADQVQLWALTTGGRAAHTPLFRDAELPLVQQMADALNDAYCAGILQGNRTRPEHEGLERLAKRIAALNPDAGEIGPGMLASLVAEARALVP